MSIDWILWRDVAQTELWRAVALSLGYDPYQLPGYRQHISHAPFDDCPVEFQRRLFIARSHIGSGLKSEARSGLPLWNALVGIRDLREWANTLESPWSFPRQYPMPIGIKPKKEAVAKVTVSSKRPRSWLDLTGTYVIDIQRSGLYSKSKELFSALERFAKEGNGPFEIGEGGQRGSLVIKETGTTVSYKTVQNRWTEIRMKSRSNP